MSENKKPAPFQHVDGGLREQLQQNIVDDSRPLMERMMSGIALLAARGLLDEANKSGGLALPGTAAAPPPLQSALPAPASTEEK
jgi:hypothetical protein